MDSERARKRHRWVKLRLHVYICRDCGTGYENLCVAPGQWERVWYLANGSNQLAGLTPECSPGARGAAALRKYADAI